MKNEISKFVSTMMGIARLSKLCVSKVNLTTTIECKLSRLKSSTVMKPIMDNLPYGRKSILRQSSILLQDGSVMRELPIIMRCTDHKLYPFTNSLGSDEVRDASNTEQLFRSKLLQCTSVKEIFQLLEIPSEQVSAYSAAYTLINIANLQTESDSDYNSINTFIKSAVLNELYDTVIKNVSVLTEDMLCSLVRCYLKIDNFSQQCADSINTEIESRLGDNRFTITDMCHLATTLSNHKRGDKKLIENIWITIGMNFASLDKPNIAAVYKSLPMSQRKLLPLLNSQFKKVWWELSGDDIATVASCLLFFNTSDRYILSLIGKWCFGFIDSLTQQQLENIITAFIHFNFADMRLIFALERFIPPLLYSIKPNLLAITVEYIRQQRYLSVKILNTSAAVLIEKGASFNPLQLFTVLRSFGHLNHVPENYQSFFRTAENLVLSKFAQFSTPHIVELLSSFCFIGYHPVNVMPYIFTPSFHARIAAIKNEKCHQDTLRYLELFSLSLKVETNYTHRLHSLTFMDEKNVDSRRCNMRAKLRNVLEDIFGSGKVKNLSRLISYLVDFEIQCDHNLAAINVRRWRYFRNEDISKRLALMIILPEHRRINDDGFLGEHAMKIRLLTHIGYTPIELNYDDLIKRGRSSAEAYVRARLHPHMFLPMSPK